MSRRTLILPIGAGVIGQDDVPLVRIMDSDETPTTITVYGVVDTVQPVTGVTWTVNGVEQTGDASRSPVLELTDLQPETSYAITLRATNINGESSASARTITTKKITTVTPNAVLDGVSYYNLDVYYTGNIPTKDENDIVVNGRDVTVPTGYYAESETVSVSSDYIIPTGTKNITDNGNEDVTQYANVNVNVPASAVVSGTKNITTNGTEDVTNYASVDVQVPASEVDSGYLESNYNINGGFISDVVGIATHLITVDVPASAVDTGTKQITANGNNQDVVGYAAVDVNVQPNLDTLNVTPSTSSQTLSPTGGIDGWDEVNVGPVGASIDSNIQAGNIKKDVTILGVTGTYDPSPSLTGINIVPTKQAQVITPTGGVDGFDEVNVSPVTALIDNNITPQNIKKDVAILGVTGTFEGGIQPTGTLNIVNNGTYDITNYANVTVNVAAGNFNELCFTALQANSKVGMSHTGTNATTTKPVMYYSTDGRQTWNLWDYSNITLANVDDKVYFYGQNLDGFSRGEYNYSKFGLSGKLSVSGNIMTLITRYGDRDIPNGGCFYQLFNGCASLKDAQYLELPSMTTGQCYSGMFGGTGIVVAPNLPAEELTHQCYFQMFRYCGSLTTIQTLNAKRFIDGYAHCSYMFSDCTNLVNIPDVLEPTELLAQCYDYMFANCRSITKSPILPATTIPTGYFPYYSNMFDGCTSLNEVTTYALALNQSNWLNNVAATGTFYKMKGANIPIDSPNGVPVGWTVVEIPVVVDDNEELTFNAVSGTTIYYTTDGTVPTTSSTLYTQPIDAESIGNNFTLKYLSVYNGTNLPIMEYDYSYAFYIEALEDNTVLNVNNWGNKMLYSTDKSNWSGCDTAPNRRITLTNTGDKVYFKKSSVDGVKLDVGNVTTVSGTIKTGGSIEYAATWKMSNNTKLTGKIGNLFENCTGLVDASDLILIDDMTGYDTGYLEGNGAYYRMFKGCTNLVNPPKLTSQQLNHYCYKQMFYECTSLTVAPDLPATLILSLREIYNQMFYGCTSLTSTGKMSFTTLNISVYHGCDNMFDGCTNLSRVYIENCTNWYSNYASNWLNNVAATGTFVKPAELVIGTGSGQIPANSASGIPTGWTVQNTNDYLCFTANSANSTIGLENGPNNSPTLYYSTDNGTSWSQWDYSTITLQNVGDKVYFYGDNPNGVSTSRNAYSSFKTTNGSCTVSGNIMSLIHYSCPNTIPNAYCFNGLFQSTTITSAANLILPATTLTDHCYAWMFWNCSNLVTPPQLPSTTLATYCYFAMFFGNSSLTSAPALNAATLLDYSYAEMFDGCSLLNSITCLATDVSATHSTYYWLNDVAQSGTFTKDSSMSSWTTGIDGIPTGWTVVDAQ